MQYAVRKATDNITLHIELSSVPVIFQVHHGDWSHLVQVTFGDTWLLSRPSTSTYFTFIAESTCMRNYVTVICSTGQKF